MLTHGFTLSDLKSVIGKIDATEAKCEGDDRAVIDKHIVRQYGSLERFNTELRLRLMLQPVSYNDDIEARSARRAALTTHLLSRGGRQEVPASSKSSSYSTANHRMRALASRPYDSAVHRHAQSMNGLRVCRAGASLPEQ